MWAVVAALFVMHPERGEAMKRVCHRVAGTFVGVAAAWLVVRSGAPVAAVVALAKLAATFIPWGLARGQFHRSLAITLFVLLLFDVGMLAEGGDAPLVSARIWDTLVGAGAVALATAALQRWRGTARGPTVAPRARAPAPGSGNAGRYAAPGDHDSPA